MTTTNKTTTTASYSAQYKAPRWQKKRLEILERDNFQCIKCRDKESTLHVHHMVYISGNKIWDYNNSQLATLCDSCHEQIHKLIADIDMALCEFSMNWIYNAPFVTIEDIRSFIWLLGMFDEGVQSDLYALAFGALNAGTAVIESVREEYILGAE